MPIHWQHDFTCFCTLRHYVIVNFNVKENDVQYVHSKTDDPRGSYSTQFECFLIVSTKTGKKSLKINVKRHSMSAWNDVWATWESHRYVCKTAGMSTRDVARHFKRHEFQQTGNFTDRPRSGRPRKTTLREDRFLTTSSRRNGFLSRRKLGRLLRNATGTKVYDRTVRNRLHAARLKACRPYVGIPLMWRNYRASCCIVFVTT